MDPWFLVAALLGLLIGLVAGVLLASVLVRGHYSHFLTNSPVSPSYVPPHHEEYLRSDRY